MADEPERPRSWWQSVPGALTALAALITAITGLFVALNQLGILGDGEDPARPGLVATSDAQGTGGAATTLEGDSDSYDVVFPQGPLATDAYAVYEIVKTTVAPRNPGELSLRLTVRITNNYFGPVLFSNDTFLLVVDGLGRSPVGELYETVPSDASAEGVVEFAIPEAGGSMLLRLSYYQEEVELPLEVRRS